MKKLELKVTFITPLIMSNVENAFNYKSDINKELKILTKKGKHITDADRERIAELSWYNGIYQKDGKIIVPGSYIRGGVREAAKIEKMGKSVSNAIISIDDAELQFSRPKTIKKMSKDANYYWTRPVRRGVLVTNPKFSNCWFITIFIFDERIVDEDAMIRYLKAMRLGLKMGYGRVEVEVLKSEAL